MTDSHCHEPGDAERHFICDPCDSESVARRVNGGAVKFFHGTHPWDADKFDAAALRRILAENPDAGVGEIGLDRLKEKDVSPTMRDAFIAQLEIAAEFSRPVVLHGAKCWGEVVKTVRPFAGRIPAFLFHGFSRSDGLMSDLTAVNGFVTICPAILNDHAVNYRRLAAKIPNNMLLIETDRTRDNAAVTPSIHAVAERLAKIRGISLEKLTAVLERNADRFIAVP